MKLRLIKEGKEKNEIDFKDNDPSKELPELIVRKIERKIKDGAKDYGQEWENSIKLVDWALEELNIDKPKTVSNPRWKQYLAFISSATTALYKARREFGTLL